MGTAMDERRNEPRRFGVEEEYLLLSESDGAPVDRAEETIGTLPEHGDTASREFFASQLETATGICTSAAQAEHELREFRRTAAAAAAARGAIVAGSGLPPVGGDVVGTVTPETRYRAIDQEMRAAGAYQYVTGTHVHVEVPSRDAGVAVLRHLARWAPALLAMTANSPVWCGEATGFASWRSIMSRNWPLTSYPPEFFDGADYDASIAALVESGVLLDSGLVTWLARLSERYPTVELRIADAQLSPREAVDFAVVVRALVERALHDIEHGLDHSRIAPGLLDGAIWNAARNGLETTLVDPVAGESLPAFDLLERMIEQVRPELVRFGDMPRVEHMLVRLREEGSPARRQIARFAERGIAGLLELYREGSESPRPRAPEPEVEPSLGAP